VVKVALLPLKYPAPNQVRDIKILYQKYPFIQIQQKENMKLMKSFVKLMIMIIGVFYGLTYAKHPQYDALKKVQKSKNVFI